MINETQLLAEKMIRAALCQVIAEATTLRTSSTVEWPTVPCPVSSERVLLKQGKRVVAKIQFREERITLWMPGDSYILASVDEIVHTGAAVKSLLLFIRTPRESVRVIARLESFVQWLRERQEGVQRARKNLLKSQEPWTISLEARAVFTDMSFQNPDNLPTDVVEAVRQGKAILGIKILRDLWNLSLADAKNHIDRIRALNRHLLTFG